VPSKIGGLHPVFSTALLQNSSVAVRNCASMSACGTMAWSLALPVLALTSVLPIATGRAVGIRRKQQVELLDQEEHRSPACSVEDACFRRQGVLCGRRARRPSRASAHGH